MLSHLVIFPREIRQYRRRHEFSWDHTQSVSPAGGGDGFAAHHGGVTDLGDVGGVHDGAAEGFGVLGSGGGGEVGGGGADDEGGDGDASAAEFGGEGSGEGEDVGLGGEVGGHPWAGHEGGDGGDVEDSAMAALAHAGEDEVGQVGEGFDVEAEELEVAVDVGLVEGAMDGEAGVVDEIVDLDAALGELAEEFSGRAADGKVEGYGVNDGSVFGGEVLGAFLEFGLSAGDEDEIMAVGGEDAGEFVADAAGCAGDEGSCFWIHKKINHRDTEAKRPSSLSY